jgi:hypothetical protein
VLERAKKRWTRCVEWERDQRKLFLDDIRFLFGDPDNNYQWPDQVRYQRNLDGRPMLTVNKTHTHWLMVVNDGKQNKPSVKVHPVGNGATYESAQVYEGIIRHIEYISNAQTAYDRASEFQVGGGVGYWRLITKYTDDNGFDQEIFIQQIADPMTVYMDPDIKELDGSDARFGFIFDEMLKDDFERKYPDSNGNMNAAFNGATGGWITKDKIRLAEYFEIEEGKEYMFAVTDEQGQTVFKRESDFTPEQAKLLKRVKNDPNVQKRRVDKRTVRHYTIAGNEIVDKAVWAGKYIPIVRCIGEEVIIDGRLERKGLVRYLKDAQRMYNYNSSAQVEFGALQSKSPYIAPVEAIEGLENYWATANRENHAYLPYNSIDEQGNPVPKPERQQPPTGAPVYESGIQIAAMEMQMASGQYEATFGQKSNERSGVAIDERQRQGDKATYHFIDGLAKAIRFTGKQLIDLIPKIYDTERIIRILAENGDEEVVSINPQMREAMIERKNAVTQQVEKIFNPTVGTYDVVADVGPNYDTKREEEFKAIKDILVGQPALLQVIGDLLFAAADFPGAPEIQERLKNWIPKEIQNGGPDQATVQLQQQLQGAMELIKGLQQQLTDKTQALQIQAKRADIDSLNHLGVRLDKENSNNIATYKAETERMDKLKDYMSDAALKPIIRELMLEIMNGPDLIVGNQAGESTGADAYQLGVMAQNGNVPM